jgi:hypothetical protein
MGLFLAGFLCGVPAAFVLLAVLLAAAAVKDKPPTERERLDERA